MVRRVCLRGGKSGQSEVTFTTNGSTVASRPRSEHVADPAASAAGQLQNKFKLCCLVHAIHYGRSPAYLTETVQSVGASRSRCGLGSSSTSSMDYSLPRLRTKFGERAFSHADPATWNALPDNIRTVADPVRFRKLLKSHYFSQAFNIC